MSKLSALRGADLFVLPTINENFGLAIAEALAAGTPVITTKGAPWSDLAARGCGWWIEPETAALSEALRSAMGMPRSTLNEMGKRGRTWMVQDFSWEVIAQEMLAVYRWLSGNDNKPCLIRLT